MSTAWKKIRYPLEWLEFGLDSEWRYPRLEGKCFFSFKLGNPTQQTRRFIELSAMNILLLLVIALLFLSGSFVNAGPVGDFFTKAGLPYGIPVPGRKGMVTSPYTPDEEKYVDVSGFGSGSIVKDPYTGKFFLVP